MGLLRSRCSFAPPQASTKVGPAELSLEVVAGPSRVPVARPPSLRSGPRQGFGQALVQGGATAPGRRHHVGERRACAKLDLAAACLATLPGRSMQSTSSQSTPDVRQPLVYRIRVGLRIASLSTCERRCSHDRPAMALLPGFADRRALLRGLDSATLTSAAQLPHPVARTATTSARRTMKADRAALQQTNLRLADCAYELSRSTPAACKSQRRASEGPWMRPGLSGSHRPSPSDADCAHARSFADAACQWLSSHTFPPPVRAAISIGRRPARGPNLLQASSSSQRPGLEVLAPVGRPGMWRARGLASWTPGGWRGGTPTWPA